MIKGILELFTSGEIFNPMVLLGIITGLSLPFIFPIRTVLSIYAQINIYAAFVGLAVMYNVLFKRVYKEGGLKIDYVAVVINIIFSAMKISIASALSTSLTFMFFGFD